MAKTVNGVTTWFAYDGEQVILDVSASTKALLAEYGFDGDDLFAVRTPRDTLIAVHAPTNGTVTGLALASYGQIVKKYDVLGTPFGQQARDTSGFVLRYKMGSQEYDQETGLYHLGARYYDPQLHRFLSEDPAGIAGGLNLYAYAGSDPINHRDPSGLVDDCYLEVTGYARVYYGDQLISEEPILGWVCVAGGSGAGTAGGPGAGASGGGGGSGSSGNGGPQQQPQQSPARSCSAQWAHFGVNAAIDLAAGVLSFTGVGLAARGAATALEGGLTRTLAGSVGTMGFQVAGRQGVLRALSGAGGALLRMGLEGAQAGGTTFVVASLPDRALVVSQTLSVWDLIPGVGTVKAGIDLYKCLTGK